MKHKKYIPVLLVLIVFFIYCQICSAMPCPTRGSLDGREVPIPFLGGHTYRAFGEKLQVTSEINDPSVRSAKIYTFKDGVLQDTKTRWLLLHNRNRILFYRFPIEENTSYQIFLEAKGKEYLYRYCVSTISDETNMEPSFPMEQLMDVFDLEGTYLYTITEDSHGAFHLEKEEAFSALFQNQALYS